jgi:hypothetical protein
LARLVQNDNVDRVAADQPAIFEDRNRDSGPTFCSAKSSLCRPCDQFVSANTTIPSAAHVGNQLLHDGPDEDTARSGQLLGRLAASANGEPMNERDNTETHKRIREVARKYEQKKTDNEPRLNERKGGSRHGHHREQRSYAEPRSAIRANEVFDGKCRREQQREANHDVDAKVQRAEDANRRVEKWPRPVVYREFAIHLIFSDHVSQRPSVVIVAASRKEVGCEQDDGD